MSDQELGCVLLIDVSGSMHVHESEVNKTCKNIYSAFKKYQPTSQMKTILFNDSVQVKEEEVDHFNFYGNTALYDAIESAAYCVKESKCSEKFLLAILTDGQDNASEIAAETAGRHLTEMTKKGKVIVYCPDPEEQQGKLGLTGDDEVRFTKFSGKKSIVNFSQDVVDSFSQ